jgi:hypothetical protein
LGQAPASLGVTSKSKTFRFDKELSRADVTFQYDANNRPVLVKAHIKWHKTVKKAGKINKRTGISLGGRLCLVSILLHYFQYSPVVPAEASRTPCFRWPSGEPLTSTYFRAWLALSLTSIGVDASKHNTHSLRQGGASALTALNVTKVYIQIMGRWVDGKMPKLYSATEREMMLKHQADMGRLTHLHFDHDQGK